MELDEWRRAVRDLSEVEAERNTNAHRTALGVVGDKDDDRYGGAA